MKRVHQINTRWSADELAQLSQVAARHDRTVADTLRLLIRKEAQKQRTPSSKDGALAVSTGHAKRQCD